jgi:hypothetical protein
MPAKQEEPMNAGVIAPTPQRDNRQHSNGQLRPLVDRKSEKQMERRTARLAMHAGREAAKAQGMVNAAVQFFFQRSFWGRLKLLVLGR